MQHRFDAEKQRARNRAIVTEILCAVALFGAVLLAVWALR